MHFIGLGKLILDSNFDFLLNHLLLLFDLNLLNTVLVLFLRCLDLIDDAHLARSWINHLRLGHVAIDLTEDLRI